MKRRPKPPTIAAIVRWIDTCGGLRVDRYGLPILGYTWSMWSSKESRMYGSTLAETYAAYKHRRTKLKLSTRGMP